MSQIIGRVLSRVFSRLIISRESLEGMKPYVSVLIIIVSLFSVVFFKMEVRRLGYSVLKVSRQERRLRDYQRHQIVALAKITRPQRLQQVAQTRLTLKRAEAGQIIQMTDYGIALKQ